MFVLAHLFHHAGLPDLLPVGYLELDLEDRRGWDYAVVHGDGCGVGDGGDQEPGAVAYAEELEEFFAELNVVLAGVRDRSRQGGGALFDMLGGPYVAGGCHGDGGDLEEIGELVLDLLQVELQLLLTRFAVAFPGCFPGLLLLGVAG